MDIVDIVIIVFLFLFALIGFKRGFFKSLVMFVGFIIVIFWSYVLKNHLGDFMVLNLPFMEFQNFLGGAVTLNIIMYQSIAFIIMLAILSLVYKIVVTITGIFEKILKFTIILGIPSKILGLVVGFIEGYVILYLILFFLSQPFWSTNVLEKSSYAPKILDSTPILSSFAEDSLHVFTEIREIISAEDKSNIDLKIADVILKDGITSPDVMQELVNKEKIKVDGIQDVINKFKGEWKYD